jgi:hypothetical protein
MRVLLAVAAFALSLPMHSTSYAMSEGAEAADAGQKIICKERRKTGTRFTTRTCKTADQWDKMAEEHRASAKEMIDRPQIPTCGPNGCD